MFDNNIKVEPIPERVWEFCKLADKGNSTDAEIRNKMIPEFLNNKDSGYYSIVKNTAKELDLISIDDDNKITYTGSKEVLKSMDNFRRYCNSVVWKNTNTNFYKVSKCFLDANERWLKYNTVTGSEITREIYEVVQDTVPPQYALGTRFWLSFLGFGYVQENGNSITFLPNMYIALKDLMYLANIEKGKEYTVSEFVSEISKISDVATVDSLNTKEFNMAFSNALRQMHDKKEIEIKRNLDSKETWKLQRNSFHAMSSEITHILIKGVKL